MFSADLSSPWAVHRCSLNGSNHNVSYNCKLKNRTHML